MWDACLGRQLHKAHAAFSGGSLRTQATVLMPSGWLCRRAQAGWGTVGAGVAADSTRSRTAPTELTVLCTPGTARRELVRQPCSEVDRALAWDQALAVAVVPELEAEALAEAEAEATSC